MASTLFVGLGLRVCRSAGDSSCGDHRYFVGGGGVVGVMSVSTSTLALYVCTGIRFPGDIGGGLSGGRCSAVGRGARSFEDGSGQGEGPLGVKTWGAGGAAVPEFGGVHSWVIMALSGVWQSVGST